MKPGVSALAASLGALLVGTAVAVGSGLPPQTVPEPLTRIGVSMVRPEHEMPAYVVGVVLALAGYVAAGRAGFGRGGATTRNLPGATPWLLAACALAAASAPLYPYLRGHQHLRPVFQLSVLGPACIVACALAVSLLASRRWMPARVAVPVASPAVRRGLTHGVDLLVVAGILLAVGVHPIEQLASRIYINERFFHWEHFLFTPALGHMSGLRLGADMYSQYGVAYPVLYAWLADAYAWGYTPALGIAVAIGALYYIFAYVFLRMVTGRVVAAAFGLILLLSLYQFPWTFYYTRTYTVWQIPSATLLRSPLDLLTVFCVWRHHATGRWRWLAGAGGATGASLAIALDMGVLLGALLATYVLLTAFQHLRGRHRAASAAILAGGAMAALTAVALAALAYGLVSGAFDAPNPSAAVTRLAAGVTASAVGGVGANRLLASIHWLEWLYFVLMVAVYLAAAGRWLAATLSRTPPAPIVTAGGLLGLYGLMRGIFFVWNTVPQVLFRGVMPLALVLALWLAEWRAAGDTRDGGTRTVSRSAFTSAALLLASAALLALNPSFRDYPSLLRAVAGRGAHETAWAAGPVPEIPLPQTRSGHAADVRTGLAACRALAGAGVRTAILHDHATFYYWYGGLPLWGDNPNVYYLMYTRGQLAAFLARLDAFAPDYVLLARQTPGDSLAPLYIDVHAALLRHVEARYVPSGMAGEFTVFARPGAPGMDALLPRTLPYRSAEKE